MEPWADDLRFEHRTLRYPVSAGMVVGFMGATAVTTQFALRSRELIAGHGRDGYGDLRALIAHNCPRMRDLRANALPELPRWFLTARA